MGTGHTQPLIEKQNNHRCLPEAEHGSGVSELCSMEVLLGFSPEILMAQGTRRCDWGKIGHPGLRHILEVVVQTPL